jgi:hypothetical protein
MLLRRRNRGHQAMATKSSASHLHRLAERSWAVRDGTERWVERWSGTSAKALDLASVRW